MLDSSESVEQAEGNISDPIKYIHSWLGSLAESN